MKHNVNNIKEIIKESRNKKEVLEKLGGDYRQLNKVIVNYNIDVSHFKNEPNNIAPIEMYLVEGLKVSSNRLKYRLFKSGLKSVCCEKCKLKEWLNEKIPLELHHIDGNRYNNKFNNLQILCANCHALTPNYRRKKNNKKIKYKTFYEMYPNFSIKTNEINLCECGEKISVQAKKCKKCSYVSRRKVNRPSKEELYKEIENLGFVGVGKKYGVSDNSIRKWLKSPLT